MMAMAHSFKLLLLDDSFEFRKLIMAYLKAYPFEICEAEDGSEALELMKEQEFHIVLMDIRMPLLDGLATTRSFREWETNVGRKHLTIIALTAFSLPHEKSETFVAGFDQFISKPINREELIQALSKVVQTL